MDETKSGADQLKEKYLELKCSILHKKCNEIQGKNNATIEHLCQLQKVVKRQQRKRGMLLKRLLLHGDKLRMAKLRFMLDDRSDPTMVEISDFIKQRQLLQKGTVSHVSKQSKDFKLIANEKEPRVSIIKVEQSPKDDGSPPENVVDHSL